MRNCKEQKDDCTPKCGEPNPPISSSTVIYKGELLSCIGADIPDTLESIIKKFDTALCKKIEDILNFNSLLNIGNGTEIYRGKNSLGRSEIATLSSPNNSVNISYNETTKEVNIETELSIPSLQEVIDQGEGYLYASFPSGAEIEDDGAGLYFYMPNTNTLLGMDSDGTLMINSDKLRFQASQPSDEGKILRVNSEGFFELSSEQSIPEVSWGNISGDINNQTDLINILNGKEDSFSKNEAFNKDFGTTSGTVAEGNDSRIINGQTAYEWGDHSTEGYLTSYTETDPTVPSHVKSITTTEKSNWNTAYGWGDHSTEGYLKSESDTLQSVTGRGNTTTDSVGIGITTTPSEKLEVGGNITADKVYSTSATSSLRKLKKNILPFEGSGLDLVNSLKIQKFDYKKEEKGTGQIGIMADDSPEEFLTEEKDAVNLYKTIFVQAKAIQELSDKNKELERKLEKLLPNG